MCSIPLALTIGSSVAGLYQQQQAANAQEDYNKEMYRNAVMANNQRNAQISQRQIQERDSAQGKLMNNNIEAAKAASAARVGASGAGVSGISIDSLLGEIGMSQGRYNASVGENLRSTYQALDWERTNSYNGMASTINSLKTPAMPDYLGAALRIGTGVYDYNNQTGGSLWGSGSSVEALPESKDFDYYYNMSR